MSSMNKLKYSWILWGIIMVTIVGLLFIYGLGLKKIKKPYKAMEKQVAKTIQAQYETNRWYPEDGESITISLSEFIEEGVLGEVVVGEKEKADKCDGYIVVSNNNVVEFKTYLKCKKYTTYGYENIDKKD